MSHQPTPGDDSGKGLQSGKLVIYLRQPLAHRPSCSGIESVSEHQEVIGEHETQTMQEVSWEFLALRETKLPAVGSVSSFIPKTAKEAYS